MDPSPKSSPDRDFAIIPLNKYYKALRYISFKKFITIFICDSALLIIHYYPSVINVKNKRPEDQSQLTASFARFLYVRSYPAIASGMPTALPPSGSHFLTLFLLALSDPDRGINQHRNRAEIQQAHYPHHHIRQYNTGKIAAGPNNRNTADQQKGCCP